eukprot:jgi/Mesen1/7386/ME000382S06586
MEGRRGSAVPRPCRLLFLFALICLVAASHTASAKITIFRAEGEEEGEGAGADGGEGGTTFQAVVENDQGGEGDQNDVSRPIFYTAPGDGPEEEGEGEGAAGQHAAGGREELAAAGGATELQGGDGTSPVELQRAEKERSRGGILTFRGVRVNLEEFGADAEGGVREELDAGGWKQLMATPHKEAVEKAEGGDAEASYTAGVQCMLGTPGVSRDIPAALGFLQRAADSGLAHAQSALAFLHASGYGVELSSAKSFLLHSFAASEGSYQSKMALAYSYLRQQEYELAAKLYGEVAARSIAIHRIPGAAPLVETVRLYDGGEESAEAVRGHRGEDDETIQAVEQFSMATKKHDADGQYNLGVLHLYGLGVKRSPAKAFNYFSMAANRQDHLGALFQLAKSHHRGLGTQRDATTAAVLYKAVAERGPWGGILRWAHARYMDGEVGAALMLYSRAAELGYEVAQSNAAWLLDKYAGDSGCVGPAGGRKCLPAERHVRAHRLWRHASEQGNVQAALLIGDAYFYGKGTKKDLERASEAYLRAAKQRGHHGPCAQAMFNLGFMHEHGLGMPTDAHLAKRYYDDALSTDPDAALPVKLALAALWLRQHHATSYLMRLMDSLPEYYPVALSWCQVFLSDEGNVTMLTLGALLVGVLYLRQRQRRALLPVEARDAPAPH